MEGDCTHNPEDWKNKSIKSFKLSVYKCTNSIRSTIKSKTVLHEICKCQNQRWKRQMLIWMIDSLLLYRKVKAGLVPPNLLISHGIPVSSGSNPEVVTTQIKKGKDQPRTQRKKKEKKNTKKTGRGSFLCESSLGGSAC